MIPLFIALSWFTTLILAGEAGGGLREPFKVTFDVITRDGRTGSFIIEAIPAWSHLGAERMRELVDNRFFDESKFFHVIPNFMASMGIAADPQVTSRWGDKRMPDDPKGHSVKNTRGTVAFMTRGPNSRTTHMLVNLKDNPMIDGSDLVPIRSIGHDHQSANLPR